MKTEKWQQDLDDASNENIKLQGNKELTIDERKDIKREGEYHLKVENWFKVQEKNADKDILKGI